MSDEIDQEETFYDVLYSLQEYTELDGTEWGEAVQLCEQLWHYRSMLSDELVAALEQELKDNLEYAQEELEIVEETETYTRTIKRLEQKYE